ncbi:MAG: sodium:solute symporter family protein [Rhodospirillales bacterium]|nr:sodium:solute symporter family protein [Rhodospirillales bacterium]
MGAKTVWLVGFLAAYWAFCLAVGVRQFRAAATLQGYALAGTGVPKWTFILAFTAASLGGWVVLMHPALIYRDGFPYAVLSFIVVVAPLAGLLFLKRQWLLGRRYGYLTSGEMFADYFGGDGLRVLMVAVTLLFAVPYLGLILLAVGQFFGAIAGAAGVPEPWSRPAAAAAILAAVLVLSVVSGGFAAAARGAALQSVLLLASLAVVGLIAWNAVGGWEMLQAALAKWGASAVGPWGTTQGRGGGNYNAAFAVPGALQFTLGLGKETPLGGLWTGVMGLTVLMAMAGIVCTPLASMCVFASGSPGPFATQQVWVSGFLAGLVLFVFGTIAGTAAHVLGADARVTAAGLAVSAVLPAVAAPPDAPPFAFFFSPLVPTYLGLASPWLFALLAVGIVAALQAIAGLLMATAGTILSRDVYRRYLDPTASDRRQVAAARTFTVMVTAAALLWATTSTGSLLAIASLAFPVGVQLALPLMAICWMPWITRKGATVGLCCGIAGVVVTESAGVSLLGLIGLEIWGRWPWTIHSAGWGILANVVACLAVSAVTQDEAALGRRLAYHRYLRDHASLPAAKQRLKPLAWILVVVWLFFGVGPGAVVGNDIFGSPDSGPRGWLFGVPSIWAWQILFWLLGVALLRFLATTLELSTMAPKNVKAALAETTAAPEQRT